MSMMTYNIAVSGFLTFITIILAVAIFFCLLRGLLGPRFTDRIIAMNLIGTKTIILICVISVMIGEHYLVDVALIYSIISFLAVVVLVNLYITVFNRKKNKRGENGERDTVCEEEKR